MFTMQGFGDIYSLLYHAHPPTEVLEIEPSIPVPTLEWTCESHRHHLLDAAALAGGGNFFESRRPLFFNDDITVSIASPDRSDECFYRNALCDELVGVGKGEGELHTPFGVIRYGPGDLIVIPRGTTQFWKFDASSEQLLLVIESKSTITPPSRYLTRLGQFAFHSPISERDVRAPQFVEPRVQRGRFRIRIKTGDQLTVYHYARHPFDALGWDGYLYPYAINMREFEPVTRRIHTMPDQAQIFETNGAAICCLVPRLLDYHPKAIPAPPYHSSVDVDEIIFNMSSTFMGWKRPSLGVMTFHPRGIVHGSKPGGYEGSIGMKEFDAFALMIDAANPLKLTRYAQQCDDVSYPSVWLEEPAAAAD
jgi:homogentisate 1,2-dioxygenase